MAAILSKGRWFNVTIACPIWATVPLHRFMLSNRALQWRHNGHDSVSNHQPNDCLLNHLFRRRSKKTSKIRVTGLCARNSPGTGEFPAEMASNAENVFIWWRHHGKCVCVIRSVLCLHTRLLPTSLPITDWTLELTRIYPAWRQHPCCSCLATISPITHHTFFIVLIMFYI